MLCSILGDILGNILDDILEMILGGILGVNVAGIPLVNPTRYHMRNPGWYPGWYPWCVLVCIHGNILGGILCCILNCIIGGYWVVSCVTKCYAGSLINWVWILDGLWVYT